MPLPAALSLDLRGRSLTRIRDWTAAELEAVLDLADELKAKQRERGAAPAARRPHARTPLPQALDADARLARGRRARTSARPRSTSRASSSSSRAASRSRTRRACSRAISTRSRSAPTGTRRWRRSPPSRASRSSTPSPTRRIRCRRSPTCRRSASGSARSRACASPGSATATNVCVSLAEACALLGAELTCATPPGYEPSDPSIRVVRDPREAAEDAHVLVTDVWVSMGQEDERERRVADLAGYSLDDGSAGARRPGGDRAPLPARASGRGDRRRRPLRAAERGLGRGREQAAHGQGAARADRLV